MSFIHYILDWFHQNKRPLPWREQSSPYHVWVSEIILQQTRVDQGIHYYIRFISEFPTLQDLANANEQSVLRQWQGLGYYSRARNLHKAAKIINDELNGKIPTNFISLKKLPGIGPYTAAAIASICFGEAVPAIDGNAYRVYARYFGIAENIAGGKAFNVFFELGKNIISEENPGDFNEAVMELGATICLPKKPKCEICPIVNTCFAYQKKEIQNLPLNVTQLKIKEIQLNYFFISQNKKFLVHYRAQKGFWQNLYDFPTQIPLEYENQARLTEQTSHILSHRKLNISFHELKISKGLKNLAQKLNCTIVDLTSVQNYPVPKPIENFINQKIKDKKNDKSEF